MQPVALSKLFTQFALYRIRKLVQTAGKLGKEGMQAGAVPSIDIAVLDDDRDFRGYLEDFLVREGAYSVRTFAHPDDLYEACRHRLPGIVLLDVKIGEIRGEEVLDKLLAQWPELCVIIVTGYPSLEDMRATFKRKVFDYLVKPFPLAQLRQTLNNAIDSLGIGRSDPERLRHRLGHRLRILRAERDWSLRDLADAAHLSVSQISSIERGAHLPSIESLFALSRAFNVRPSQLLSSIDF
jgi:FixJ family two-component response regulator